MFKQLKMLNKLQSLKNLDKTQSNCLTLTVFPGDSTDSGLQGPKRFCMKETPRIQDSRLKSLKTARMKSYVRFKIEETQVAKKDSRVAKFAKIFLEF